MKNNIAIQETNKESKFLMNSWNWFCKHAFKFGVCFGVLAYLLILFSFVLPGSFMGLACMLCFWADDVKK